MSRNPSPTPIAKSSLPSILVWTSPLAPTLPQADKYALVRNFLHLLDVDSLESCLGIKHNHATEEKSNSNDVEPLDITKLELEMVNQLPSTSSSSSLHAAESRSRKPTNTNTDTEIISADNKTTNSEPPFIVCLNVQNSPEMIAALKSSAGIIHIHPSCKGLKYHIVTVLTSLKAYANVGFFAGTFTLGMITYDTLWRTLSSWTDRLPEILASKARYLFNNTKFTTNSSTNFSSWITQKIVLGVATGVTVYSLCRHAWLGWRLHPRLMGYRALKLRYDVEKGGYDVWMEDSTEIVAVSTGSRPMSRCHSKNRLNEFLSGAIGSPTGAQHQNPHSVLEHHDRKQFILVRRDIYSSGDCIEEKNETERRRSKRRREKRKVRHVDVNRNREGYVLGTYVLGLGIVTYASVRLMRW